MTKSYGVYLHFTRKSKSKSDHEKGINERNR